jgi:hypothetical protein
MDADVRVNTSDEGRRLFRLAITDSFYLSGRRTPIIPDHGKPMHLFLIREGDAGALGHFHPAQLDSMTFEGGVPALPAGDYRYYADVVQESGAAQTLTGRLTLSTAGLTAPFDDPDDATFIGAPVADSIAALSGGVTVTFSRPPAVTAGTDLLLQFAVRDSSGAVVSLEPYMGMPAHAMVARTDGEVFAHLHSNGSFSMASLQVLEAIERGDTLAASRPNAPRPRLNAAHQAMTHAQPSAAGELDFLFAFPSAGTYAIWVQFRYAGVVRTVAFTLVASEATT